MTTPLRSDHSVLWNSSIFSVWFSQDVVLFCDCKLTPDCCHVRSLVNASGGVCDLSMEIFGDVTDVVLRAESLSKSYVNRANAPVDVGLAQRFGPEHNVGHRPKISIGGSRTRFSLAFAMIEAWRQSGVNAYESFARRPRILGKPNRKLDEFPGEPNDRAQRVVIDPIEATYCGVALGPWRCKWRQAQSPRPCSRWRS